MTHWQRHIFTYAVTLCVAYVSAAFHTVFVVSNLWLCQVRTREELSKPENIAKLLSKVLPTTDGIEVIRQRVYTHNARIADKFRVDRILL